ncbi:MAG: acetyl-CoA carboxylase carboxyltransferase subunit alpha [Flavobacteriales bacterium]|nr:acetyl-CoA carboxylase carboxyltransferase subunit alpha [Flavobacteriales bacterium]MCX7649807.1 acetyl-CoA carboxylase carboxyltransferase subunit alpha [Flavobacteriales bacterium]MDW8431562.1 acetyl-CoA carboxylase carboxyltransferase subunit alpha [Flavobacteriales bacterium]
MNYLDFEEPLRQLTEERERMAELAASTGISAADTLQSIDEKIEQLTRDIYSQLTAWQKVQVSRHPDRPYVLAYMTALSEGSFIELHGDRGVKDDKAMVGGLGMVEGQPVMFVGQQKGINAKMRMIRRFGMANPEGYRKALRLMRLAEKFNIPVCCLIDTPGAYPGLEAEERGQGEAIARNIYEMFGLRVPIVVFIIGEGASGGALGIGVGDRVYMLQYTWYSVISPESCSSILWRSWDFKEKAAEALKLTADDMLALGLVDGVVPEPLGGAHRKPEEAFAQVKKTLLEALQDLRRIKPEKLVAQRREKFLKMAVYLEK